MPKYSASVPYHTASGTYTLTYGYVRPVLDGLKPDDSEPASSFENSRRIWLNGTKNFYYRVLHRVQYPPSYIGDNKSAVTAFTYSVSNRVWTKFEDPAVWRFAHFSFFNTGNDLVFFCRSRNYLLGS